MLSILLDKKMKETNTSARKLGNLLGVSHTTIIRARQGMPINYETLQSISTWLNIPPSQLMDVSGTSENPDQLSATISALLSSYPKLMEVFSIALKRISTGEAPPELIAEITNYAIFRINSIMIKSDPDTDIKGPHGKHIPTIALMQTYRPN